MFYGSIEPKFKCFFGTIEPKFKFFGTIEQKFKCILGVYNLSLNILWEGYVPLHQSKLLCDLHSNYL